ncbi:VPLPA-CTERM sorting domain-containing protein [Hyphococcus luteus]|uniref:PEP-CTERM protein-sorting domain-containing protein n=1 Tax=Hyphococcus luteus TaxID=2058213 RepID=A0A2S7JZF0_9PROT|nr:VPLPA-CTERM sorting domain-containing protein [Marinicaulis flavus]PQA85633.1 hypothetical protein CW354_22140 [Marinicaulis flavus]
MFFRIAAFAIAAFCGPVSAASITLEKIYDTTKAEGEGDFTVFDFNPFIEAQRANGYDVAFTGGWFNFTGKSNPHDYGLDLADSFVTDGQSCYPTLFGEFCTDYRIKVKIYREGDYQWDRVKGTVHDMSFEIAPAAGPANVRWQNRPGDDEYDGYRDWLITYYLYGIASFNAEVSDGLLDKVNRSGEVFMIWQVMEGFFDHTVANLTLDYELSRIDGWEPPLETPLPAAGWLLLSGLAGMGFLRRRRR